MKPEPKCGLDTSMMAATRATASQTSAAISDSEDTEEVWGYLTPTAFTRHAAGRSMQAMTHLLRRRALFMSALAGTLAAASLIARALPDADASSGRVQIRALSTDPSRVTG